MFYSIHDFTVAVLVIASKVQKAEKSSHWQAHMLSFERNYKNGFCPINNEMYTSLNGKNSDKFGWEGGPIPLPS